MDKAQPTRKTESASDFSPFMNPQSNSSPLTSSDLLTGLNDLGRQASVEARGTATLSEAELVRWQELLGQVGRELAEPLTAALERVTTLTTTGRIDRAGLRA